VSRDLQGRNGLLSQKLYLLHDPKPLEVDPTLTNWRMIDQKIASKDFGICTPSNFYPAFWSLTLPVVQNPKYPNLKWYLRIRPTKRGKKTGAQLFLEYRIPERITNG
jgi:hypothetical protein